MIEETRVLSLSAMQTGYVLIFYLIMKVQCIYWYEINNKSKYLSFFEYIFYPLISILFPVLVYKNSYSALSIPDNMFITFFMFSILYILLSDRKRKIHYFIKSDGYLDVIEKERGGYFFLNYPPRDRVDLLPLDIIIYLLPLVLYSMGNSNYLS